MPYRIFSGIVAAVLFILFVGPVVVKLKEPSLVVVVLIGLTMMIVDIVQSLRSGQD